jgi:hypothetical protein
MLGPLLRHGNLVGPYEPATKKETPKKLIKGVMSVSRIGMGIEGPPLPFGTSPILTEQPRMGRG